MSTTPTKFTLTYHEPKRNDPCVCGSGLKFKKCCSGAYSSNASELFRTAFNQGRYDEALVQARRHFTWYALAYKAHTVPLLEAKSEAALNILRIDIEALADLLNNIQLCYFHLQRSDEFPNVIQHSRDLINDRRWIAKIAYAKALWCLVDKQNKVEALAALNPIDILKCQDPDVLALYLDVSRDQIPFNECLEIIDRIITNTSDESVRLQYRILKALQYCLICQHKYADQLFNEAISAFDALPDCKKSYYGRMQLAYALEIFGNAKQLDVTLARAKDITVILITEAQERGYTPKHIADLHRLLGDCEEKLKNHSEAVAAYKKSLENDSDPLTKIFLARSVCNLGDNTASRILLRDINEAQLNKAGKFDLAISWALLATNTLLSDDIKEAIARLKVAETQDPLFFQLRDQWMIEMLETKPKNEPGRLRKLIHSINSYVTLEPSFCGIGININKIIDNVINVTSGKQD